MMSTQTDQKAQAFMSTPASIQQVNGRPHVVAVTINGDAHEIAEGLSVTALLEHLGLHPRLIVVEHNREILDRSKFDDTTVHAGDVFELVHFVGGG